MNKQEAIDILETAYFCRMLNCWASKCDECYYVTACYSPKSYGDATEMAIAALEQQDKEPCEYCGEAMKDIDGGNYYIKNNQMIDAVYQDEYGIIEITINYCPMCGRKLEGNI